MILTNEQLKKILVDPGHLSAEQFDLAEKEAKENDQSLEQTLLNKGLIKDEQLGQLVADARGCKFINLKSEKIDPDTLNIIPEKMALGRGIIAFQDSPDELKIGMVNPNDFGAVSLIQKKAGKKVEVYYITETDFKQAANLYRSSLKEEFNRLLMRLNDQSISRGERDEIIVKMVDTLLQYALRVNASDIHIEPHQGKVVVRFRIDGVMHKVLEFPKSLFDLILTRIKILGKMRTDEHHSAQDGKLRFYAQSKFAAEDESNRVVDVRISIVPVVEGENVVMRLLAGSNQQYSLTDLGLASTNYEIVKKAIQSPHGMILVTGPTGSGKTTTLYAILKMLNQPDVHISTIEDPVEYGIDGISQIQTNPKTDLTFAKGLRAIVRQDPDIIMVGEIRDTETAGIAINSAMTGHLVLSTLHTNDAATTLPRLIDMDIEPYLVASTVNIVIAQRLVRKICYKCRASFMIDNEQKDLIRNFPQVDLLLKKLKHGDINKIILYHGLGCKLCDYTGYYGRIGIFEVLRMTDEIRKIITAHGTSQEIMDEAKKEGMITMLEDGVEKALNGVTTLDEILRAVRE